MLGHTIAKLRKARGLTQAKFAEEIHVTQGAVSQWETGRTTPDVQQMFILSSYFGITIDELTEGNYNALPSVEKSPPHHIPPQGKNPPHPPPPPPLSDLDAEMMAAFRALPSDQLREEILSYARYKAAQQKGQS